MTELSASQLAERLGVTRARISQLVREGKLDGCYRGEGRARRFDLERSAAALERTLDPGQVLGNGAEAAEARRAVAEPEMLGGAPVPALPQAPSSPPRADEDEDTGRYKRARADAAAVAAEKAKLALAQEEGRYTLTSEVDAMVRRKLAAELTATEAMLRRAASAIAAEHEVDARSVKAMLFDHWRRHRLGRSGAAGEAAETAGFSAAEIAEQAVA